MRVYALTLAFIGCSVSCISSAMAQIDTTKWHVYSGPASGGGTFNCATPANLIVANGTAQFTLIQQTVPCGGSPRNYTSPQIASLFTGTFGTIRVRAQWTQVVPTSDPNCNGGLFAVDCGNGTLASNGHSGIWLFGIDCQAYPNGTWSPNGADLCPFWPYPANAVNIQEAFGAWEQPGGLTTDQNFSHGPAGCTSGCAVVYTPNPGNAGISSGVWRDYTLRWTSTQLLFQIDGTTYQTVNSTTFPGVPIPQTAMYLNIWLNASYDLGSVNHPHNTPTTTSYIKYVRWCSDPNAVCDFGDPTMIFNDEFGTPPFPARGIF